MKPGPIDPYVGGVNGHGRSERVGPQDLFAVHSAGRAACAELDEMNRLASEGYNTIALGAWEHRGRTFLNEKLVIPNRSCTCERPGKRVGVH
jgi:hypothetical protein